MPVIQIEGDSRTYMFSVVEANHADLPDWGGIFIAINSESNFGIKMSNCVCIGACDNFNKYRHNIMNSIRSKFTHLYLLPDFQAQSRQFALEDILKMDAFSEVKVNILEKEEKAYKNFRSADSNDVEFVNLKN